MPSVSFPIINSEIEITEEILGIRLPPRYKSLMLDQRVYSAMSSVKSGLIDNTVSMEAFARISEKVKELDLDFPKDAVVMFAPVKDINIKSEWGYLRFWLPDEEKPGYLSEIIYSWDSDRKMTSTDCTNEEWVSWVVETEYGKDSGIYQELGIPVPE